jgi:hypothetical protein
MYCTAAEVYGATSLSTTEIAEADVNEFIRSAEEEVDDETFTTYWAVEVTSVVSSATDDTITVTGATWDVDAYVGMNVWIYKGTGIDQVRRIESNTDDTITLEADWTTNPVSTDKFRIIYTANDANYDNLEDGSGKDEFFVPRYPIRIIDEVIIEDTTVTLSKIYTYKEIGKLILSKTAEQTKFSNLLPQQVDLNYWYGVYPIPSKVKRYVIVLASLKTLAAQMGGTYDTPSTYSLPEGSVTIGQAYINIRGTFDVLRKEQIDLIKKLIKYPTYI